MKVVEKGTHNNKAMNKTRDGKTAMIDFTMKKKDMLSIRNEAEEPYNGGNR